MPQQPIAEHLIQEMSAVAVETTVAGAADVDGDAASAAEQQPAPEPALEPVQQLALELVPVPVPVRELVPVRAAAPPSVAS